MATMYWRKDRGCYEVQWTDAAGKKHKRNGSADKAVARRLKARVEREEFERRAGLRDAEQEGYAAASREPLSVHLDAWEESLAAAGSTRKHVDLFARRARRVVALLMGAPLAVIEPPRGAGPADRARAAAGLAGWVARAKLPDLTEERAMKALAALRAGGRSLQTCNHHRASIRTFSRWCHDTRRAREHALRTLKGFNVRSDRRHDRRTIGLGELQRLIAVAERGPVVRGMSGPARALCYRLAATTGLRYGEIATIRPGSFDWGAPSVRVAAAYTKNGQEAELPIPGELAADLRPFVAAVPADSPVFPLPFKKGAEMLRVDLEAAGIEYVDAAGQYFDFHSLRCQTATLADQAGASPRVVQKLMRHSSLELTWRYTKPRAVDIEAAVSRLPSLKPAEGSTEAQAMTGTEGPAAPPAAPKTTVKKPKSLPSKKL
jgi:integrase